KRLRLSCRPRGCERSAEERAAATAAGGRTQAALAPRLCGRPRFALRNLRGGAGNRRPERALRRCSDRQGPAERREQRHRSRGQTHHRSADRRERQRKQTETAETGLEKIRRTAERGAWRTPRPDLAQGSGGRTRDLGHPETDRNRTQNDQENQLPDGKSLPRIPPEIALH